MQNESYEYVVVPLTTHVNQQLCILAADLDVTRSELMRLLLSIAVDVAEELEFCDE